jgi:hypothetical protein
MHSIKQHTPTPPLSYNASTHQPNGPHAFLTAIVSKSSTYLSDQNALLTIYPYIHLLQYIHTLTLHTTINQPTNPSSHPHTFPNPPYLTFPNTPPPPLRSSNTRITKNSPKQKRRKKPRTRHAEVFQKPDVASLCIGIGRRAPLKQGISLIVQRM